MNITDLTFLSIYSENIRRTFSSNILKNFRRTFSGVYTGILSEHSARTFACRKQNVFILFREYSLPSWVIKSTGAPHVGVIANIVSTLSQFPRVQLCCELIYTQLELCMQRQTHARCIINYTYFNLLKKVHVQSF
jgi:hypothetical protein